MMSPTFRAKLSACLLFLALCAPTRADQVPSVIPLTDFFRNPQGVSFALSPDGKSLASLRPWNDRLNVFIEAASGGESTRLTNVTDRDLAGVDWKGDDILLYTRDEAGDENFHVHAVDRDGKNDRDLTPFPGVRADIVDTLDDDPDHILVQLNRRDKEVFDAFRLDVQTGELKLVAQNPGNVATWITDWSGQIRAATTTDGVNTSLLYRKTEDAPWKTVLTTNFRETFSPEIFTFDNQNLIGISNLNRDKAAVVELDPETGKELKVIFETPLADVTRVAYSKKRKVLTLAVFDTWKTQVAFLDKQTEDAYHYLEQKFPGYEVGRTDFDKEEDKYIVSTSGDRTLGSYYLYDLNSGDIRKLVDLGPWLHQDQLAEMKPISYQARDGLTINGYLTLPEGRTPKNLPVVVNPHGGPWARDGWGFNPEVQFLANRGYAVLQMNFRGSTGYGRSFWEASFKQWGGTMQDDVTDGVNWLIQQGIADPKRIAIYGGSYGGYATLEGLVKETKLFAAGVDYCGVSNLLTFLKTIPPYWKPELEMMYQMVGDPVKDKAWLVAHSPALNADRIQTPLFVAQGAKDPRVNIAESDQIVNALKARHVPVAYLVKQNEGHGFSNQENRFDFYQKMEAFLQTYLHPDSPPAK
jgi:dipeptidyl aminopeptidase/acylaminoacyl peptidase